MGNKRMMAASVERRHFYIRPLLLLRLELMHFTFDLPRDK